MGILQRRDNVECKRVLYPYRRGLSNIHSRIVRTARNIKQNELPSSGKIISVYVVGLERGPLSLVSTTEELLDRKVAAAV
jgi:hypothetical protein